MQKHNSAPSKRKIGKPPTLRERITETATGGHSKPIFIPKQKEK